MTNKTVDYRKLREELDNILNRLQNGELSIDEALPAYARGMKLVKELETYLKTAENSVKQLKAKLQD